jgi:hypothetical protein
MGPLKLAHRASRQAEARKEGLKLIRAVCGATLSLVDELQRSHAHTLPMSGVSAAPCNWFTTPRFDDSC